MNRCVNVKLLLVLTQIIYPNYDVYCFVIYMLMRYCLILRKHEPYTLRAVSRNILKDLLKINVWDLNNTVIVNEGVDREDSKFALLVTNTTSRKVFVITKSISFKSEAILSHNLIFNLGGPVNCFFRKCKQDVEYADEVELSLVNSPNDWSHHTVDTCLKNYFKTPKMLCIDDIIEVKLKDYGIDLFFATTKIVAINCSLHFKCNKILYKGAKVKGSYLCVYNRTTVKQCANVQSYIPASVQDTDEHIWFTLDNCFEEIKNAVSPFIIKRSPSFIPTFLLEGRKGSGKSSLVQCIAAHFGVHLYSISSFELSANVYAQNETKLRNAFFNAKMAAPAILEIRNFENFGKNNEGQYDERLINHFKTELNNSFLDNRFPLILFCCTNEKNIPTQLRRTFLKTFEVKAPSELEREHLLRSFLKTANVEAEVNLKSVASKTHGFLFEDLKILVRYAATNLRQSDQGSIEDSLLRAVDFMHTNFNESLGAPKVPNVKWADVGGLNDVKEEIARTIKVVFKHNQLFKRTGLKRSGIMLFGPPGTGKTLIAKAVASECGLCFLSVKGPELLNMYVGQSEQNVREVFERAREASPCIIFFDELDSLAPNRGISGDSGGVMDRVVSQLLAEMDGLNRTSSIFIIAATNRPDLIDPALLRPGRFDKLLYVGPCTDRDSKAAVLRALTKKFQFSEDSTIEQIVDLCPENFSGADLYGVCSNAWLCAVRRLLQREGNGINHDENWTSADVVITLADFEYAVKTIKPSIRQEDLDYFNRLKLNFK